MNNEKKIKTTAKVTKADKKAPKESPKKALQKAKGTNDIEKIPLSQVVHVDIDDEVSSIYERVAKKTSDLVYVIVPHRAVLFQSIINLKILKRKAKDLGKELALITKDKSGIYFANKCNIPVYDQVNQNKTEVTTERISENILTEAEKEQTAFVQSAPVRSEKEKSSIADMIKKVGFESRKEKIQSFFFKLSRKKSRQKYAKKLLMANPNKTLLAGLTIGSLLLLGLIVYIAIPNTTIIVKPNTVPIEHSVNITLADAKINAGLLRTRPNKVIASYKIEPGMLETIITYDATGNDLTGENAKGLITITNSNNQEFPLVPFTRFQTEEGLIFRTQGYVNIPPHGETTIEVLADIVDINNLVIGERGNLKESTKLFIPGLAHISKETLYATVIEPFEGGVASKNKIVTSADIEASKEFAIAELNRQIPKKLQDYLVQYNTEKNLNLSLLNDQQTIEVGEIELSVDESLIGQQVNQFTVSAKAPVAATAYDQKEFIQILTKEINLRKSPDKVLVRVDQTGVTNRILSLNPELGITEVTATITGIEKYNLTEKNEAGQKIINKIHTEVPGLEVKDAKQTIESFPEIESATINTWPFWAPTVPSRSDSIKVEINNGKL